MLVKIECKDCGSRLRNKEVPAEKYADWYALNRRRGFYCKRCRRIIRGMRLDFDAVL